MGAAHLVAEGLVHLAGLPAQGFNSSAKASPAAATPSFKRPRNRSTSGEGARFRCGTPSVAFLRPKPLATPERRGALACRGLGRPGTARSGRSAPDHRQQPVALGGSIPIDQYAAAALPKPMVKEGNIGLMSCARACGRR